MGRITLKAWAKSEKQRVRRRHFHGGRQRITNHHSRVKDDAEGNSRDATASQSRVQRKEESCNVDDVNYVLRTTAICILQNRIILC